MSQLNIPTVAELIAKNEQPDILFLGWMFWKF